MKISKNWLKRYVDFKSSDLKLAEHLTDLGLECNLLPKRSYMNICVGFVEECTEHPNADRLKICNVNIGKSVKKIVCGAPNIKKGLFVPVALPGAKIGLEKFEIKKAKIRGIESNGMICSGKELGVNDDNTGIMCLDDNLQLGQDILTALDIKDDTVFELDITPNRGDCFSHLGIAREISIFEKNALKSIQNSYEKSDFAMSDMINVNIEEPSFCDRYSCKLIKNIRVIESPTWLKDFLLSIGQKPINSIVDIANFIMFDTGQPLHAFDFDKIEGSNIIVKFANDKDKLVSINNIEYSLNKTDLVISDKNKPIAIAGVIGSNNSHVDKETVNILIESAVFNPISVRKTSKVCEISTESSKRFERGVDINKTKDAMDYFIRLVLEISGGSVANDCVDIISKKNTNKKITFDVAKCNSFLGTSLNDEEMKNIFNSLNIDCSKGAHSFKCSIPTYRNDLNVEVDLYEEIARVYGYNNIASTCYYTISTDAFHDDRQFIEDKLRLNLQALGFSEHYSNSFCNEEEVSISNKIHSSLSPVKIKNPLSMDMNYLRCDLIPGLLRALSYNEKRSNLNVKLFEIGSISNYNKNTYNRSLESRKLGICYLGDKINTWRYEAAVDIVSVKTDVYNIFKNLGFNNIVFKVLSKNSSNNDIEVMIGNKSGAFKKAGNIFILNKEILNYFTIKSSVIIVDLDIDLINKLFSKSLSYEKPSQYPSSSRDISILVEKSISHEQIQNCIYESSSSILKEITLFDIYEGENIDKKSKSLAYRLEYQSKSKTLTDNEVDVELKQVLDNLKLKLGIIQR